MAADGAILLTEAGEVFTAEAPDGKVISAAGSGDSMVAGFLAGLAEKNDPRYALRLGICAGSAGAFTEGLAEEADIRRLMESEEEV